MPVARDKNNWVLDRFCQGRSEKSGLFDFLFDYSKATANIRSVESGQGDAILKLIMNLGIILSIVGAVCCTAMALAAVLTTKRSIARWAFFIGMLALAMESAFTGLTLNAASSAAMVFWQNGRLIMVSLLPGAWLFFSLTYGRGNYQEFLKKWNMWLAAIVVLPVGMTILLKDDLITAVGHSADQNQWVFQLGLPGLLLQTFFLLGAVLILVNLERTYRASVGTIRWRIKFMLLGVGVLFAVRTYVSSQALLFRYMDLSLQSVNSAAIFVASMLILRSLLRAGHFNVDVYPSQSVLRHSLTILLTGVYLLTVGILAKIVASLGGDASFTIEAFLVLIALVLLATFLLSDRARLQLKRFVSRHFHRPLYDYRGVWRNFTERTASCGDQTELCRAVVKLVADIFQVLSVTIWLVDESKEKLIVGASTSLSEAAHKTVVPTEADALEIITALRNHPEPIDIDASKEPWAIMLQRYHPDEFERGGSRVCVPFLAAGEIHGLMTLGDRVSGAAFLQQDFDLLKCIADEAAASLCSLQLSRKLLQAKELEAFQTMSAFFVHDLKNTASTLNLMLKNLPEHFDNPEFREDALRGIAKIVSHINSLIKQLSLLRHELKLQPAEADLNEVVAQVLADLEMATDVNFVKELRALPKTAFDRDQILKVVTNLIFNAREAVARNGQVRIETSQGNGWMILAVADNGCGMSPEFLNRSLFRPFQTTKKNGLGIGMFQSKMIVEAHGGRLEAQSQPGKGSVFRMFLPLQKQIK